MVGVDNRFSLFDLLLPFDLSWDLSHLLVLRFVVKEAGKSISGLSEAGNRMLQVFGESVIPMAMELHEVRRGNGKYYFEREVSSKGYEEAFRANRIEEKS